jgi:quinol monooxygenase YgiN
VLRLPCLLLIIVIVSSRPSVPIHAQPSLETRVYSVSYVEVTPSGRAVTIAALKAYRDMSSHEAGYLRVEALEQIGRPGHFAIVETWTDQRAFDAHGMARHAGQLRSALQPIRVSDYDQRVYKALTAASATAAGNRQAVHVVVACRYGWWRSGRRAWAAETTRGGQPQGTAASLLLLQTTGVQI